MGFEALATTEKGVNFPGSGEWTIKRVVTASGERKWFSQRIKIYSHRRIGERSNSRVRGYCEKTAVRVPILYYHRVEDRLPPAKKLSQAFAAQMEYLRKRNYRSITFEQLADYFVKGRPLPSRPVIISLDDGYLDNFTRAYPILKQNGFRAIFETKSFTC